MSIRRRGKQAYQVRVPPFPAVTVPTREAAKALELDLKLRKRLGHVYEEKATTLGAELDGLLERKRATGNLRPRGIEWYERSVKPWDPLRHRLVPNLRRREVEDHVAARARRAPVAARNELQVLKQALRAAEARGQRVDASILDIPPVRTEARVGRALTVAELYELASWFPEHARRLVLLAGFVGARQRVWFELTDGCLDLAGSTLAIPSALSKNRRAQVVALTPIEVGLLREQLLARARGTGLVFPTPTGKQWTRGHFRDRVWADAVKAAGLTGFRFHDLRHTAISLAAASGMRPELIAARVGHTDGGALIFRRYRHLFGHEMGQALGQLARFQTEPQPSEERSEEA